MSIRGSISITSVGVVLPPLASLLIAPVLAHALGVEGRGEAAAATAPFLLAASLLTFGIPDALTHVFASGRTPKASSVRALVALTAGAGVVAVALIAWCAEGLLGPDARPGLAGEMAVVSGAIPLALAVAVVRGRRAGEQRWRAIAAERALGAAVKVVGVYVLAATGSLTVLNAALVIAYSVGAGLLAYVPWRGAARAEAVREVAAPGGASTSAMLHYAGRAWVGAVAGILIMRADQFLMVPLSDAQQLGLYVVAVNVAEVPLLLNAAVREVMFASDARSRDSRRLAQVSRVTTASVAVVAAAVAASAPWWIGPLFGEGFEASLAPMWVLLIAVVIGVPGSIAGAGIAGRGHPGVRSMSMLVGAVVNVALVVALVPMLGALGAAVATVAGNVFSSGGNLLWSRRILGLRSRELLVPERGDVALVRGLLADARARVSHAGVRR